MDLSLLQNNIQAKKYHSTEAFAADTKWIQHNYTIYPGTLFDLKQKNICYVIYFIYF